MKHLKIKKHTKLTGVKKLKHDIKEIVHSCLLDIEWYIVEDVLKYLKKRGILYEEVSKKNKKKKKR